MGSLSFLQVTAQWNPSAPDTEPPRFADVWKGFETGEFEIDRLLVRHDKAIDKRALRSRSFDQILMLDAAWSSLPWSMDLPKKFCKYIYEGTSGHLSLFFRQPIGGALKLLEFWKHWEVEPCDDLSMVVVGPEDQSIIRRIVEAESGGKLLLSFWSERSTVVWFGEPNLLEELEKRWSSVTG